MDREYWSELAHLVCFVWRQEGHLASKNKSLQHSNWVATLRRVKALNWGNSPTRTEHRNYGLKRWWWWWLLKEMKHEASTHEDFERLVPAVRLWNLKTHCVCCCRDDWTRWWSEHFAAAETRWQWNDVACSFYSISYSVGAGTCSGISRILDQPNSSILK